jgi:putative membrane protein
MGILELKIRQSTGGEKEEQKSAIEIPGCSETERDAILKLLFHKIPEEDCFQQSLVHLLFLFFFLLDYLCWDLWRLAIGLHL